MFSCLDLAAAEIKKPLVITHHQSKSITLHFYDLTLLQRPHIGWLALSTTLNEDYSRSDVMRERGKIHPIKAIESCLGRDP